MKKILIALVLAVVMSGNVYAYRANFDGTVSYSECIKAIEKGDLIHEVTKDKKDLSYSYLYYLYKNKIYQIRLTNNTFVNYSHDMSCYVAKEE
mgnify:CR=1 FL=1